MKNDLTIYHLDDYKVFSFFPKGSLVVDNNLIDRDDTSEYVKFPVDNVCITYKLVAAIPTILISSNELDENDFTGRSYCFETPKNMWLAYGGCGSITSSGVEGIFLHLFVPDVISNNEDGRMNWFVSVLGIGQWKITIKTVTGNNIEIKELIIPPKDTDRKSAKFKQFMSELKKLNIKMVSRLRF